MHRVALALLPIPCHGGLLHLPTASTGAQLQYIRLYSNQNGDSAFEDLDIEQAVAASTVLASTAVAFRSFPSGWSGADIVPDERLLVVMLTGMVELTASDGSVRRIGPGDVVLVEDTWGKGHAARTVSDDATVQAFVQLTNAA